MAGRWRAKTAPVDNFDICGAIAKPRPRARSKRVSDRVGRRAAWPADTSGLPRGEPNQHEGNGGQLVTNQAYRPRAAAGNGVAERAPRTRSRRPTGRPQPKRRAVNGRSRAAPCPTDRSGSRPSSGTPRRHWERRSRLGSKPRAVRCRSASGRAVERNRRRPAGRRGRGRRPMPATPGQQRAWRQTLERERTPDRVDVGNARPAPRPPPRQAAPPPTRRPRRPGPARSP